MAGDQDVVTKLQQMIGRPFRWMRIARDEGGTRSRRMASRSFSRWQVTFMGASWGWRGRERVPWAEAWQRLAGRRGFST